LGPLYEPICEVASQESLRRQVTNYYLDAFLSDCLRREADIDAVRNFNLPSRIGDSPDDIINRNSAMAEAICLRNVEICGDLFIAFTPV
jgi:hypothetical protein